AGGNIGGKVETLWIVNRKWSVEKMLGLRLGHSRCDSLCGEPIPDWRQLLHNRAISVKLRGYFAGNMPEAVRTRKKTVEVIEAAVLGVDHHNVFNLVDSKGFFSRPVRSMADSCAVEACSKRQHRRE